MLDINHLLQRADRTFKERPPKEALQRVRAIVGPSSMPADEEGDLANRALDALRSFQRPTPKQLAALEKMIRLLRPAPLVRNGRADDFPDPLFEEHFPSWKGFQNGLPQYASSIGRVAFLDNREVGTGFLVAPDLIVTNEHVLRALSNGVGVLEKGQAVISFTHEFGSPVRAPVAITGVKAIHDTLDAVLLSIEDTGTRKLIPVAEAQPQMGMAVVAVGFPAEDRNNPLFMRALFGNKFEIKRAAPGEIIEATLPIFYHDCSTLGGNSGSPVFRMDTVEVIGLHQSGAYLWRNEAIAGDILAAFVKANSGS